MERLLVLALATWEAVEIWHHGSLFADRRDTIHQGGGWRAALVGCPFCLAPWVAGVLLLPLVAWSGGHYLLWPLAAARLANLGNDLGHARCRTPGRAETQAQLDRLDALEAELLARPAEPEPDGPLGEFTDYDTTA